MGSHSPQTRILIADAFPLFRSGIRQALAAHPDLEVAGEAGGPEVVELAIALDPDVVICDVTLPTSSGLEVCRRLRFHLPNVAVILLAVEEGEEPLFEAVKAGASAYLSRAAEPEELIAEIRRVARGEHTIDDNLLTRPTMASKVLLEFNTLRDQTPEAEPLFAPLTSREMEILEHISRGYSNKQIARVLAISDQTVKNHITSILKKLAVNDRTEAVVYSLRQGWITMDAIGPR
jgi:DNA-binding NarL/FixJ family response regulator